MWKTGGKPVAAATHSFNQAMVPGWFKGLAQATDMDIYRSFLKKYMVAPYLIKQLAAGKDPFRVCHEKMQKTEFSGA